MSRLRSIGSIGRGLLAVPLLVMVLGGPSPAAERWEVLSVPELGFAVDLPGTPQTRQKNEDLINVLAVHQYVVPVGDGIAAVSVMDFRPAARALPLATDEQVFRYAIDNYVGFCEGALKEEPLAVAVGSGRQTRRVCNDDKIAIRTHYHLVGNRLFNIVVGGPDGVDDGEVARRIFESFRITNN